MYYELASNLENCFKFSFFQYEETHFDNINLFYFYMYFSDRMSAEKKKKSRNGNALVMAI